MYKEILPKSSFLLKLYSLPNTILNGYEARVNFTFCTDKDNGIIVKTKNIDKTLLETNIPPVDFPFNAYCEGFTKEFKKEVNADSLSFVLRKLLFNNWSFNVSYINHEPYIKDSEAYNLGEKIGRCYNYWHKVIMDEELQESLHLFLKDEQYKLGIDNVLEQKEQSTYPHIFDNCNAEQICIRYFENYIIDSKTQNQECSFLYWQMYNDNQLTKESITPTVFANWLDKVFSKECDFSLNDKLKSESKALVDNESTGKRRTNYSMLKDIIKQEIKNNP